MRLSFSYLGAEYHGNDSIYCARVGAVDWEYRREGDGVEMDVLDRRDCGGPVASALPCHVPRDIPCAYPAN